MVTRYSGAIGRTRLEPALLRLKARHPANYLPEALSSLEDRHGWLSIASRRSSVSGYAMRPTQVAAELLHHYVTLEGDGGVSRAAGRGSRSSGSISGMMPCSPRHLPIISIRDRNKCNSGENKSSSKGDAPTRAPLTQTPRPRPEGCEGLRCS